VRQTGKGANTHRAEITILAVADGLLTVGIAGEFSFGLTLEDVPDAMKKAAAASTRALIWRFSEPQPA
jgi:hypothetical protein